MASTTPVQWIGRVHRIGGSLGLVLPKKLRDQFHVVNGDYFAIVVIQGMWVLRRIEKGMVLDRTEVPVTALQAPVEET
jgi:antitoxin component of MazEF toxin-antitoxin module